MRRQHGVALVTSILLLLILTLVAVSLAARSRTTVQMSAAGIAREEAQQRANAEQEAFIERQRLARGNSEFVTTPTTVTVDPNDRNATPNKVDFLVETGCRRSRNATANGVIACRQNELTSEIVFGRNERGTLAVIAGVEQPVLKASGG